MYTNRTRPVECPACEGQGGEHAPTNGLFGSGSYTEWFSCETCKGHGTVERMERLAFLIGQERRFEATILRLTTVTKAEPTLGSAAPYLLRKAA